MYPLYQYLMVNTLRMYKMKRCQSYKKIALRSEAISILLKNLYYEAKRSEVFVKNTMDLTHTIDKNTSP